MGSLFASPLNSLTRSHLIKMSSSSPGDCLSLPVGDGDELVAFPPERPECLPNIYRAVDHPLHAGNGRAFYYIQDGSPEGMKRTTLIEHNEMSVPSGGESDALGAGKEHLYRTFPLLTCGCIGFLKLLPGDAVFSRLAESSPSGLDDVAVCWLNDRYALLVSTHLIAFIWIVQRPLSTRVAGAGS